jgi:hypothetical protein
MMWITIGAAVLFYAYFKVRRRRLARNNSRGSASGRQACGMWLRLASQRWFCPAFGGADALSDL